MLNHPFSEEIFVIIQFKPSLEQIETLSLYLRLSEQNSLPPWGKSWGKILSGATIPSYFLC